MTIPVKLYNWAWWWWASLVW